MKMQARRPRESLGFLATGLALALAGVFLAGVITGCGRDKVAKPPQAPVVRVLTPNGGEGLVAGAQTDITWTATDGDTPATNLRITIEFSSDGGAAWLPVAPDELNDGIFTWSVPELPTEQGIIRVTATDGARRGTDVSDSPFSIGSAPQTPVVRVLTPNGGENFSAGMQTEITWTATQGDTLASSLRITIELSIDGGTAWLLVATDEMNDGTFTWAVPGLTTGQGIIRVTATDGAHQGHDVSNAPFTISGTPPPPRNTIAMGNGSAPPGTTVEMPLLVRNQDPAGRIEVRILFDPAVADFQSARLTGRGVGMEIVSLEFGPDTAMVAIQRQNGSVIAPGDGPVALLAFGLVGAAASRTDLRLRQARFLDGDGTSRGVRTEDGSLTVLAVETPATLTAAGWAAFEADNLAVALQRFQAAIAIGPQYGPAYTGRGWVELTQATTADAFRAAVSSFDQAVGRGQTGADVHGGGGAARLALGGADLVGAVQEAQAALAVSPDFVFPHRTSFDFRDLHLIAAFAEAGRGGRFTEARHEADQVQASGIRLADPLTWTVDGVRYPTYEAAVVAWLHKLSTAFAG